MTFWTWWLKALVPAIILISIGCEINKIEVDYQRYKMLLSFLSTACFMIALEYYAHIIKNR